MSAFDPQADIADLIGHELAKKQIAARFRVAFSIYVHKNEFSFLNRILVVPAKRGIYFTCVAELTSSTRRK